MTKLFESSWRDGYTYYERYHDPILNKSIKKRIDIPWEWYVPRSTGLYSSILDDSIKLEKKQGKSKEAKDNYGALDPIYRNIRDNYWNSSVNKFNPNPRTWFLDIETRVIHGGFPTPEKAQEQICLMQFYDSIEKTMIVLGLREWKHEKEYKFDYPVKYIKCNDEIHLLETYLTIFKKLDPIIIYAWNGDGFDFPYIFNRMKNLGIDTNRLSNYGSVKLTEKEYQGQLTYTFKSDGHYYLDLLPIYKKFTFSPRPNYALDTIAEIELKENKISHTEYAQFDDFFAGKYIIPRNPTQEQKESKIYQEAIKGNTEEVKELSYSEFVYYGITDTMLIKRIDDKRNFTVLLSMLAEKMGITLSDAMGTVKPWSQYISNKAMQNNQILPPRKDNTDPYVVGGFVRAPERGMHEWIISEDVNSMYPLLGMVGFNMSPETFVAKSELPDDLRDIVLSYYNDQEEINRLDIPMDVKEHVKTTLKKHNVSLGINGAVFKNDKLGIIPELIQDIYKDRKIAKQTQFKYEKKAILIQEILKGRK